MFRDLSNLVMVQGNQLDSIEVKVKHENDDIEEGNKSLAQSIQYMMEIQRRRCCIAVMVFCFAGIGVGLAVAGGLGRL
jgi:t-SNARE complex subunit (syntaxin)